MSDKANILRSSYKKLGVGRYTIGLYVYWVLIFTD